jgi:competence protein ComEC
LEGHLTGPRRDFYSLIILAAGLVAAIATVLAVYNPLDFSLPGDGPSSIQESNPSHLRAIFFDVGQGDSILMVSPAGRAMLVDAGSDSSDFQDIILPALRDLGLNRLDYLVLTHPHQDHVGGMPAVMEGIDVGKVVLAGQVYPNHTYEVFLRTIKEADVSVLKARKGESFDLGAGAEVRVLWPEDPLFEDTDDSVNENSVVLRVSYGDVAVLLAGDIEEDARGAMLMEDVEVRSQILKVAHHGSHGQVQTEWLAAVAPEVAIISVGADNAYGLPHGETLTHLELMGAGVYRTDLRGTITVTTDGLDYTVTAER